MESNRKLWGDDKFAELLCRLPAERVVLTGSAAERDRIDAILSISRSTTASLNLAGQSDLAQLAELCRRCSVVVTNDSGPMHIAAAVGTPVVAVFGPTDPRSPVLTANTTLSSVPASRARRA